MMRQGLTLPAVLLCLVLTGCQPTQTSMRPRPAGVEPLVFQLQAQDDSLQNQRIRTLLDFEHPGDFVFAQSETPVVSSPDAHTGNASLQLHSASVTFRIYSVLFSTQLPGDWTLLGAYARPMTNTPVHVELLAGDQVLAESRNTLPAGRFSFAGIDIAKIAEQINGAQDKRYLLRFTFEAAGGMAEALVDNVVLVDNRRILLDTRGQNPTGWLISRQGYATTIDAPGRFTIDVRAAATSDSGWVLSEFNATRVILNSAGKVKKWVIYSDGRYIEDARLQVKGASGADMIQSHTLPGSIKMEEASGQLRVHTPGDADNDGYNELLGTYQLAAKAPRLRFTVVPQQGLCVSPIFEIIDLPQGDVSAMVEGRVIDTVERLADGRVLLKLPLRIDRSMSVTVRSTPRH